MLKDDTVNQPFVPPPYPKKPYRKTMCRVVYKGQQFYLGKWGSEDSHYRYQRLLGELRDEHEGVNKPTGDELTIKAGIAAYLVHLKDSDEGYRRLDGSLSCHYDHAKRAMMPLCYQFGDEHPDSFTAKKLRAVRSTMVDHSWWRAPHDKPDVKPPKRWGREHINRQVRRIVQFFAWLESEGWVSPGKAQHLSTLKALQRGACAVQESTPRLGREVVATDDLEIVCGFVSPVVATMLRLQRTTAMRPTEVCCFRWEQVDRSRSVWIYRPERHKTEATGEPRQIPLGRDAQEILAPFIGKVGYIFKPAESAAHHNRLRGSENYRERFNHDTYRRAVKYGITKARKAGIKVEDFTPYSLRHTRITEVEELHDLDTASAVAGHSNTKTTAAYTHNRSRRALKIAEGTTLAPDGSKASDDLGATGT